MRRLLLLRHAKAGRPLGVTDHARPLAPRGQAQAPQVGRHLAEAGLRPDLALVSTAARTRETWALVAAALGEVPVRFKRRIYEADLAGLLALLRGTPRDVATLLVVEHNPGIEDLGRALAGTGEADALARLHRKVRTAALAVLDFDGEDWSALEPGRGRLERFVAPDRPKDRTP